jgi:hypothetical protein
MPNRHAIATATAALVLAASSAFAADPASPGSSASSDGPRSRADVQAELQRAREAGALSVPSEVYGTPIETRDRSPGYADPALSRDAALTPAEVLPPKELNLYVGG